MSIRWWEWLPFQPWRQVDAVDSADEVPDRLPRKGVVLVGSAETPKWAAFDCPCGRGHRILLNLDLKRRPAWRIVTTKRWKLAIVPSVNALTHGRRCHYVVRDGRTFWAKDSDR